MISCTSFVKVYKNLLGLFFQYKLEDKLKSLDFIGYFDYLKLQWTDLTVNLSTFKSFVSNNFTTRALTNFMSIYANI